MKQYAPATQRNKDVILSVLQQFLPPEGNILEISSGTGEHCVYFSAHFPQCRWLPSDINPVALASIEAWSNDSLSENIEQPMTIDVTENQWYQSLMNREIRSIVCINMIHIAPWNACLGLIEGANKILEQGGILYLYGPFKRNHQHTAPSNQEFDQSLQLQNSAWGVRNLETVVEIAQDNQLQLRQTVKMPSNNLSVIFEKIC